MASKDTRQSAEAMLTLEALSIPIVKDRRRPGRSDASPILTPLLRSPATIETIERPSLYGESLSEEGLSLNGRDRRLPYGVAICAVLSASLWAVIVLAVRAMLG